MNVTEIGNTIVLNERQAAKRLSIGYSTLKKMRLERKISHIRIGSRVGYKLKNLTDFIEKNSVESQEK
jgi:hypothetical protein